MFSYLHQLLQLQCYIEKIVARAFLERVVGSFLKKAMVLFTLPKHKKRRDSLESSLEHFLFAAELEFSKILVHMLLQNTSNVHTECARK